MADTATTRTQYETYPYPPRDPADEAKRLITGSPSQWDEVVHSLFAGRWPADKPLRALVAGGGTGDGLVQLAQQTVDAGVPSDIHYLDLSEASLAIAEARIKARGLANVTFHCGSLLEVADIVGVLFDYIDCCGVLHHLPDPNAGLSALAGVLAPGGGMGLMVYGAYGRAGLYPLQAAIRQLAGDGADPGTRIDLAKRLLRQLPATNGFRLNPLLGDHKQAGDAGLYDLLCHETDRAYAVPDLLDWLAGANLRLARWVEPLRYEPETYVTDPALRARTMALAEADRWALAERLAGNLKTHVFYAVTMDRADDPIAVADGATVPVLVDLDGAAFQRAFKPGEPIKVTVDGLALSLSFPRLAGAIVGRLDGRRNLDAVFDDLRKVNAKLTRAEFDAAFADVARLLGGLAKMVLRCP